MKVAPSLLRYLGMALAFAASPLAHGQQVSVTVAPAPPPANGGKTQLAPELEKKVQEVFGKVKQKKTDYWNKQMSGKIDQLAKNVPLDDQKRQTLEDASKQAVTASVGMMDSQVDMLRRQLVTMPVHQAKQMLDQVLVHLDQITEMAQSDPNVPDPDTQDVWVKALHAVLTPAQYAAFARSQNTLDDATRKQIADVIKSGLDRTRQMQTDEAMAECHNIEDAVGLPKERAAKLENFARTMVDRTVELWRKHEEEYLLQMNERQRHMMLGNGFYMGVQPNETPTTLPAWTDGLNSLLTSAELAKLQAAQDARQAKRAHAMGQIMIALLDEKIAFTQEQREKLGPIADRLVKDMSELYPQGGTGIYFAIGPNTFYSAASTFAAGKAGQAELKPILDTVQLQRWENLPQAQYPQNGDDDAASRADAGSGTEPEDVERAVSSFFYEKTENERKRSLEANTLKAEDIARVARLDAKSSERLQAAARGATEEYLTTWKWFTEQQVRSQLQDLTPQNVRQRLDSLQDYFFQRNFGMSPQQDIWDETVQTELTAQQQDAWKKETDARDDYHSNAIAGLALAELDRRVRLTDAQWSKLQPLVAGVLSDYGDGIEQVFSGMNGAPWYLEGGYMLIPVAGIDDGNLKTVLTKDQMNLWTGSQEFANAANFWQMIKQMHPQRVRRAARAVIED
jgi:hypothetical protein